MGDNIEGNYYDKYNSRNPLVRIVMRVFFKKLFRLIGGANPKTILDVGCGEGYTTMCIKNSFPEVEIEGIEFGETVLKKACELHPHIRFEQGSIYSIKRGNESYDLVLSSEVLEHLDNPINGLLELKRVSNRFVLISVPNEPWWRIANLLRFAYITDLGNTPGHINHWSKRSFTEFLKQHFEKVIVKNAVLWNIAVCEKNK